MSQYIGFQQESLHFKLKTERKLKLAHLLADFTYWAIHFPKGAASTIRKQNQTPAEPVNWYAALHDKQPRLEGE